MAKEILLDVGISSGTRKYDLTELVKPGREISIGRNRDNTIVLGIDENGKRTQDSVHRERLLAVSRYHAKIYRSENGDLYLKNNSENPITINTINKEPINLEKSELAKLELVQQILFVRYPVIYFYEPF